MFNFIVTALLFSAVTMSRLEPTVGQDCSESFDQCVSAFKYTSLNMTSFAINDVMPAWDKTTLPILCRDFTEYSTCMKSKIDTCKTKNRLITEGIDDAWQYMCFNSTEEYLNHSSCFAHPNVRTNVESCNEELRARLQNLIVRRVNDVDIYCKYHNSFITCLSNSILPTCGAEAAKWDTKFATLLLKPTLSYLSCPGWKTSARYSDFSGGSNVIAIFIGLTIFIMIVVVILTIVMVKHRRRQQLRASQNPMSGVLSDRNTNDPPSYCEPYVVYEPASSPDTSGTTATMDGDSSGEGTAQFRMRFVDPLTGMRQDGGLINEADLPFKVSPLLPPPYADRPPPSFEESFAIDDTTTTQPNSEELSTTAAFNDAFVSEEDNVDATASLPSTVTLEHSTGDDTHL